MKKIAGWSVLLLMVFVLSACSSKPSMVKCPSCGTVFDVNEQVKEREAKRGG